MELSCLPFGYWFLEQVVPGHAGIRVSLLLQPERPWRFGRTPVALHHCMVLATGELLVILFWGLAFDDFHFETFLGAFDLPCSCGLQLTAQCPAMAYRGWNCVPAVLPWCVQLLGITLMVLSYDTFSVTGSSSK